MSRLSYNPALDGIRAFAVAAVILYHWKPTWVPGGWIGVDVFFVLSGYLISRILVSDIGTSGEINLKRFYWRRSVRLVPALCVMLGFVLIAASLKGVPILKQGLVSLTYLMNWTRAFGIEHGTLLGHTWSLAVEEQFYLLWPLLLSVLPAAKKWRAPLAILIAVLVWRVFLVASGSSFSRTYNGLDTHADTLMIGSLLALVGARPAAMAFAQRWGWVCAAALLVGTFVLPDVVAPDVWRFCQAVASPVCGILTAVMILAVERSGRLTSFLSHRSFVYVGLLSYALYLWHYPLLNLLPHGTLWGAVAITLSTVFAVLSRHLVELPAKRLIGRRSGSQGELWRPQQGASPNQDRAGRHRTTQRDPAVAS